MSSVLTRRRILFGTAALSVTSSASGLLLPGDALACHTYKSPVDGKKGCGIRKRDSRSGTSSNTSKQQSTPSTSSTSSTNTGTQSGSGDPQVSGQTIRVGNGSQLAQALNNASAGNLIELLNGSYSGNFSISRNGTKNNPILIKARSSLGAVMRSKLVVYGANVIVSDIRFERSSIYVQGANCRITRCHFRSSANPINVDGAENIEIDRNEIERWQRRGININPNTSGAGANPYIHRNYLHDCTDGNLPAVALGQQFRHSRVNLNARVEYNVLERINKKQTIQCKSSGNVIQYNTMIDCGGIINRHGRNNRYIGNWMERCLSLTVNDDRTLVRGNKLVNCKLGIEVMGGDVSPSQMPVASGYPYANGCQLYRNDSHRTRIGVTYSSFKRRLPAFNTTISDHKGRLVYENQKNSRVTSQNTSLAGGEAKKRGRSTAGVNA